jgi:hypothetical protein
MFKMLKHRKLKNYLILPKFQLTLILVNLIIMTFCYAMVFYQVYSSFDQLYEIGMRMRIPTSSAFFSLLRNQEIAIQQKLIIAGIISYIFSFILTIIISHRLSGPIYRLREYFKDMSQHGYKTRLSFRDGDFYSDLPEEINKGLDKITKQ